MALRPRQVADSVIPWASIVDRAPRAVVGAIKNLALGVADPVQQKLALDWIIVKACRTYDQPFRPDDKGGDRGTAFACGMQHVGKAIVAIINMPIKEVKEQPDA